MIHCMNRSIYITIIYLLFSQLLSAQQKYVKELIPMSPDVWTFMKYGTSWTSDIIGCGRNVIGFNSKEYQGMDSVSLYDYGTRFYDTRIGMWICPDPLLEQNPAANPYSFCTGDPVNRIDPANGERS